MNDNQMFNELLKKYFIPAWFDKETFEGILDREISDDQWATFLEAEGGGLHDYMSNIVMDFANDMADEYFGGE